MDVSEIIASSFFDYQVNAPILIYKGEMILKSNDHSFCINGKIELNWYPIPQIYFEANVTDSISFNSMSEVYTLITLNGLSTKIRVTSVDHSALNLCFIEGICLKEIADEVSEITKLEFGIVNFVDLPGQEWIRKGQLSYTGRTDLLFNDWKITIIKRHDYKSYYKELGKKSGFGVTHIGVVEKTNKRLFNFKDVLDLLENLSWILSFCAGRSVGICVLHGFKEENKIWTKFQVPIISNWKRNYTWIPHYVKSFKLKELFNEFNLLLSNPVWTKTMKIVLSWYFDCYVSTYTENKIVTTQMALEMLAWTYLVEDQAILTKQEFKARDMTAYKRIKKLLETQSIKFEIPDVHGLMIYKHRYVDGINLLTRVRNSIAHPVKESDIGSMNSTVKHGVLCIGTQFLELSILKILKYQSTIHNRLSPNKWRGETDQLVPWVTVGNKDVKLDVDE